MYRSRPLALVVFACLLASRPVTAEPGWSPQDSRDILDKTRTLKLAPDLGALSPAERRALEQLLAAGGIVQRLYEDQRHPEAVATREGLSRRTPEEADLAELFRLFQGPIATTLDNRREAFLPVAGETKGRNVYPWGVSREELDGFLAEHPEARGELLALRSVVRRATEANLDRDLATLKSEPLLDGLHPGLRLRLERHRRDPSEKHFYSVPYSVAWPVEMLELHDLLRAAAAELEVEDPDFAAYLRLRSRDLLTDDYEAGDAAWVSGRFGDLNAQIGSYESYDDHLYGVKSFFSLSLLLRDREKSEKLAAAVRNLQSIEDRLPYDRTKKVRSEIPVGVYRVIADFGQSRGTNTATILPNDPDHSRKYGRTILLRYNVMTHPEIFAVAQARFRAAVDPRHHDDLTLEAGFERTLWHEVGHYLGVDRTADGRELEAAVAPHGDLLEELKSDLVSLHAAPQLLEMGYLSESAVLSMYASGVLRVLQLVKPRREQPYQSMQLMQWNYFLENGVLRFEPASGLLAIDYERYPEVVESLLREVLAVQSAGNAEKAASFVDRWSGWDEELHAVVARAQREAVTTRYFLVRYGAEDEAP